MYTGLHQSRMLNDIEVDQIRESSSRVSLDKPYTSGGISSVEQNISPVLLSFSSMRGDPHLHNRGMKTKIYMSPLALNIITSRGKMLWLYQSWHVTMTKTDTRILLHSQHAADRGYQAVVIAADDTDILVIALSLAHVLSFSEEVHLYACSI